MGTSKFFIKVFLAFLSTTIDDFTIMLVFLSRAQKEFKDTKLGCFKVMIGQMIGFSVVIFVSLTASLFGLLVPENYMDLVGFFPLVIGLYKYWELCYNPASAPLDLSRCISPSDSGDLRDREAKALYNKLEEAEFGELTYEEECKTSSFKDIGHNSYHNPSIVILAEKAYEYQDLQTVIYSGELGCGDSGVEIFDDEDDDDDEAFLLAYEEKKRRSLLSTGVKNAFEACLDPFVLEVTAFSLMCASDNIAVYISLFVGMELWEIAFTTLLYYVLLISAIALASILIQWTGVGAYFENYSKFFVPTLLVPFGLYILSDSVAWPHKI